MKKSIWLIPISIEDLNKRCRNTLIDHLGIEFIEAGDDHLTAQMPVDQRTVQPAGILHGGASAALAETVGSAASNYCIDPETKSAVGLDININHIRAARPGMIIATAKPLHLGKMTHVWEIKIYNELKQLISAARLTMAIIYKNPGQVDRGGYKS